jgi:hypothetical protein
MRDAAETLHDVLPDPADQIAVIDDVVRSWQALPPASRAEYTARDNGRFNAVMHYAWAYVAQVDEAAVADLSPGTRAHDCDQACVRIGASTSQSCGQT